MAQDSVDTSGRVLDHDHVLRTGLDHIGDKAACLCYDRPVLPDPAIRVAFAALRKRTVAGRDDFRDRSVLYTPTVRVRPFALSQPQGAAAGHAIGARETVVEGVFEWVLHRLTEPWLS